MVLYLNTLLRALNSISCAPNLSNDFIAPTNISIFRGLRLFPLPDVGSTDWHTLYSSVSFVFILSRRSFSRMLLKGRFRDSALSASSGSVEGDIGGVCGEGPCGESALRDVSSSGVEASFTCPNAWESICAFNLKTTTQAG